MQTLTYTLQDEYSVSIYLHVHVYTRSIDIHTQGYIIVYIKFIVFNHLTCFTHRYKKETSTFFLADFGLLQVISTSRVLGTKTMQSGTLGFQAPEQLRAEAVDQGADVYGFGAVRIELFGEKPVWEGLNPYQIIVKVVKYLTMGTCHTAFSQFVVTA